MAKTISDRIISLEHCISIQKNHLRSGYMHGMTNGMILAHAIITDTAPTYEILRKHKIKNKIRYKTGNRK